jgi:hypothetical protein
MIQLPPDFKEFLRLLNSNGVEYLVVGGYAVGYHGHPRTTGDMDIWVRVSHENAARVVEALREFGFGQTELDTALFLATDQVIRMGVPPMRIELLTSVSGVEFDTCYARRVVAEVDGVQTGLLSLEDLRTNKRAAGRAKDLGDLEALE